MDVISGNPAGVRDLARHWLQQGVAADEAAATLGSAKNDIEGGALRLKGDFAPKIKDAIGDLPGELRKLAQGYRGCGRALDTFATKLSEAQAKSRRARDNWDAAARDKRNAEYDLDSLAPGWDAHAQTPTGLRAYLAGQPEPVMSAVSRRESADRDVGLAETLSRQAAALRGDAERDCVREIQDALEDSGLKNRSWYQKVGDYLKESFTTWDGFVKFCEAVAMVLGVVALFLTGPLALIVGAVLLIAAAVAVADKLMKLARGEIGWGELAFELGMVVLARFGGRALGPALRRLSNTKAIKGLSSQMHKGAENLASRLKLGDRARNLAHRGICTVTGHPIDVATGKMFTSAVDLALPGPLPFAFERVWYSTSTYAGPLGHGWHHTYDAALYASDNALLYRAPDGRLIELMPLYVGTQYYDRQERLSLTRDEAGYRVRTADGVTCRFAPLRFGPSTDPSPGPDGAVVIHRLQDVVGSGGQRISLDYDEQGLLTALVDSGGRDLRFEHDVNARMQTFTAPHPDRPEERFTVARYGYDEAGNLTSVTDSLGGLSEYGYENHLMVIETDPGGLSFHFEYDGTNERARCTRTWGDGGIYERRLSYEPGLTRVENSLGHITAHQHEQGLVVETTDALGGTSRTTYEYQQPVLQTDALGRVTSFAHDYRGNLTERVAADGGVVQVTFNDSDQPVSAVDPVGGRWDWTYGDDGLVRSRRDCLGRTSVFAHRAGLLSQVTDPAGGNTDLQYDSHGALIALRLPDGTGYRWSYDRLGRQTSVIDPLGRQEQREFDLAGRMRVLREPDGNERRLEYDGQGNLLTASDRLYRAEYTYQGMGRLASQTQADTTVRFEYDTEERLTGVRTDEGLLYGFGYGPTGQVSSERGFDGVLRLYEHDVLGRLVSVRRASGAITRYEYDAVDRLLAAHHSDGTGERFGYRPDGKLMQAENATTTVCFERDLLGRVTRETHGGHWVSSQYDALGSRVQMRSSLGATQVIERDELGRVRAVGADDVTVRFTHDALGQELSRELPGGAGARWQRDELGRPLTHTVHTASSIVRERTYDWDVDARLKGVLDAVSGPVRYEHDGFGQLVSATHADGRVELRMPDALGNLFRTRDRSDRRYGPAGQLLESLAADGRRTTYHYDPEGNLVSKSSDDGETWTYNWALDGTLAKVVRPDGSVVTFGYDALGRRVSKTYRGQTTRWVWDGNVPLHEWVEGSLTAPSPSAPGRQQDGASAQREALLSELLQRGPPQRGQLDAPITWVFEPNSLVPLAKSVAGRYESIVTDHIGTPAVMLDASGTPTWAGELSVWGELELRQGDRWACPFRFQGQYEDPETGLYYNRFRYYDPEAGQYTSQDPIRVGGGFALYGFSGDVLTSVDPYGLAETPLVWALFEHAGEVYSDVNPTARPLEDRFPGSMPAAPGEKGLTPWNSVLATTDAEPGAMHRSFIDGNRGGRGVLLVQGRNVCRNCQSDIKKMALLLELDSLEVHHLTNGDVTTFPNPASLRNKPDGGLTWNEATAKGCKG